MSRNRLRFKPVFMTGTHWPLLANGSNYRPPMRGRLICAAAPPAASLSICPAGNMLKKSNLLNLHRGTESFADLGGLGNLKDFCRRALQPGKAVKPRGVLLLGVPGTGKSAMPKRSATKPGGQRCSWTSARCWAALLDSLSKTSDKPCASPMR